MLERYRRREEFPILRAIDRALKVYRTHNGLLSAIFANEQTVARRLEMESERVWCQAYQGLCEHERAFGLFTWLPAEVAFVAAREAMWEELQSRYDDAIAMARVVFTEECKERGLDPSPMLVALDG